MTDLVVRNARLLATLDADRRELRLPLLQQLRELGRVARHESHGRRRHDVAPRHEVLLALLGEVRVAFGIGHPLHVLHAKAQQQVLFGPEWRGEEVQDAQQHLDAILRQ